MTRSASALFVSLLLLGLGLFVVYQGSTVAAEQSAYARVGPQVFPYVIGAGLILIGGLLARDALKGSWFVIWAEADDAASGNVEFRRRMLSVGMVALGLFLNVLLIAPLGFVVASTAMFALTTRAFGSKRLRFDLVVALVFSGAIFLTFTFALGLPLPAGTLWTALFRSAR
jgi:putative tricarboxylic transport membrane protein